MRVTIDGHWDNFSEDESANEPIEDMFWQEEYPDRAGIWFNYWYHLHTDWPQYPLDWGDAIIYGAVFLENYCKLIWTPCTKKKTNWEIIRL